MATVTSAYSGKNNISGRGPLKATVRPKALGVSSLSSDNIREGKPHPRSRSLSASPMHGSTSCQASFKSHSVDDLRERTSSLNYGVVKKKCLQDLVPTPLNTIRLKPIQQQTRRACVSITDSGLVVLVSTKNAKQETITISSDGQEV